uniref:Uncharacterized protein n=1 Tax=Ascaris lumbricoides TaxID=6252 RepID=A0A0M3I1R5_ASCLU
MLQPEEKDEVQHAATRVIPSAKSGNVKLSALRYFFVATSRHLCYQDYIKEDVANMLGSHSCLMDSTPPVERQKVADSSISMPLSFSKCPFSKIRLSTDVSADRRSEKRSDSPFGTHFCPITSHILKLGNFI